MNIFIKTTNIFTDVDCNNGRGCKDGEECIKSSHKMFKVNLVDESYVKKSTRVSRTESLIKKAVKMKLVNELEFIM